MQTLTLRVNHKILSPEFGGHFIVYCVSWQRDHQQPDCFMDLSLS